MNLTPKKMLIAFFAVNCLGAFLVGFSFARYKDLHRKPKVITEKRINAIAPGDRLVLTKDENIFSLTHGKTTQITYDQHVSEPVATSSGYFAIEKKRNYSSLLLFDAHGALAQTFLDGSSPKIDHMFWVTEPAVSPDEKKIAFVSDRNRGQSGNPDNALFVQDIVQGTPQLIVRPIPYSGGIANPMWDPQMHFLLYTSYTYDTLTLEPYSIIQLYDMKTRTMTDLTTEEQNAFQATISPDAKKLLFLSRNKDKNTVTLYSADFADKQMTNPRALTTGDLAYPRFSNTPDRIYYLHASENSDYTLMTAEIHEASISGTLRVPDAAHLKAGPYTVLIEPE